jgi:hypothetical protein
MTQYGLGSRPILRCSGVRGCFAVTHVSPSRLIVTTSARTSGCFDESTFNHRNALSMPGKSMLKRTEILLPSYQTSGLGSVTCGRRRRYCALRFATTTPRVRTGSSAHSGHLSRDVAHRTLGSHEPKPVLGLRISLRRHSSPLHSRITRSDTSRSSLSFHVAARSQLKVTHQSVTRRGRGECPSTHSDAGLARGTAAQEIRIGGTASITSLPARSPRQGAAVGPRRPFLGPPRRALRQRSRDR